MTDAEKTVFISYRREVSSYIARAIFLDLRANGYDVFMDVESIDSGTFDTIILNQIEARGHFVLVLTPGSVERCVEEGDWLRREIEYAMEKRRNIVPVLTNGFEFDGMDQCLTGKLRGLQRYNALPLYHEYFDEGMARLRTRFLKQAVYGEVVPTPTEEKPVIEQKIEEVVSQPAPTEEQLSAEGYFNRALAKQRTGDLNGTISDYDEAIRLNPKSARAYYKRSIARLNNGDLDGAIADSSESIRLNSKFAGAYSVRGGARDHKGDFDGALADYSEAIELNPKDAGAFNNRAEAYFAARQYNRTLADFQQANTLHPAENVILAGLAVAHHVLGQVDDAKRLWTLLIAQDNRFQDADWVGKELHWSVPLIEEARKLIANL
jgi:tetratricopeptide (TPR) repeat protein